MKLTCTHCLRVYEGRKRYEKTFCSVACKHKSERKRIVKTCSVCNKEFIVQIYRLKHSNVYCSKACSFVGRRKIITIPCSTCGVPVTDKICDKRKFCSKNCFQKFNKGDTHYLWKEQPSYRTIHHWVARAFGKANHCEDCGIDKLPEGKKRYFDWANISGSYKRVREDWKQLCKKCHKRFDGYGLC